MTMDDFFKTVIDEARIWLEELFIKNVPGRIGTFLRRIYWSNKFYKCSSLYLSAGCVIKNPKKISIGNNVIIRHNCELYANDNGLISIGDRTGINRGAIIDAGDNGEVIIGNDVLIGPNVVIRASNHRYASKETPINKQGHSGGKINIEDDVWIGANVVILPNKVIGKGSIVGAGAVVTKDIAPYSLAVGIPARVIKENCRT